MDTHSIPSEPAITPAELLSKMDSLLMLAQQWSIYDDRELWMAIIRRSSELVNSIRGVELSPEMLHTVKDRADAIREAIEQRMAAEQEASAT